MENNTKILRELAYKYLELIDYDKNAEMMKLHTAVNDLKPIRPVVLIDELPWSEINIDGQLTLMCDDDFLRGIEWYLRNNIFRYKYFPADMILWPYVPVDKVIRSTGIGISVDEDTLLTCESNSVVSHKYSDILQNEEDLTKLHDPVITYDIEETMKHYEIAGNILGDILPVKLAGIGGFSVGTWDDIARYRGVENILIDLIDRPDFMHKIVNILSEIRLSELEQYEKLDLLDAFPVNLHCTPALTNDLPGKDFNGCSITRKNIWGRGYAQILSTVSGIMHEEFDISYMINTVGQCGLIYYGCCEPLDKKIDIVAKIPNLRKISISPWADARIAAEAIGGRYVLSAKPNPASVAVPVLDENCLKKEIGTILDACKKNDCSCDIVLKDISTCCRNPANIFQWEKIVMDMVSNC